MSLNDAYRCMRIAADVLKESLESTVDRDLRTPSMEVFLLSLDLFDKMQDGIDFKSAEVKQLNIIKGEHSSLFYKFSHDFCDELSHQPFYNEEFNYLQVSMLALINNLLTSNIIKSCKFENTIIKFVALKKYFMIDHVCLIYKIRSPVCNPQAKVKTMIQ